MATGKIDDAGPRSLSEIIGQRSAVAQLRVAVAAARNENKQLDDCLLIGPSGLGKTALIKATANEMGVILHPVFGQDVRSTNKLADLLICTEDGNIVFIDEAHELPVMCQTALFRAIDNHEICIIEGSSQMMPLERFTLVLATTNQHALTLPLRNRMKMTIRVDYYNNEELTTIMANRAERLNWRVEDGVPGLIAERSQGVPRNGMNMLQSCHRLCSSRHKHVITRDHLETACAMEGRDNLGLESLHQKYLAILAEGTSRLNVIASQLGDESRNVSGTIEPLLIRLRLVCKDDKGQRYLTALGREHVSKWRPNDV